MLSRKIEKSDPINKRKIIFLIIISTSIRIILLLANKNPCLSDECLYGKVLDEVVRNKSLVPTYFDRYSPWKPPFTFYVYSLFYPLNAVLPIELTFRIPSLIFGVLATIIFYFFVLELLKNEKKKEEIAFYSSIVYSMHPAFLITNSLFLTDNLLAFLTLLSLLYYLKGEKESKNFLIAGFLSALAFFTKTIMAFAIIYLAVAYYFLKDRRVLVRKEFLASLLFIPVTFVLMYLWLGEDFLYTFKADATRLEIPPSPSGLGICTSAGTVGPSLSFGKADAAVIISVDPVLADAVATAAGNRIHTAADLSFTLDFTRSIPGITGVLLIKDDKMAAWGSVKLVPLQ